jgi:hypothetical protein
MRGREAGGAEDRGQRPESEPTLGAVGSGAVISPQSTRASIQNSQFGQVRIVARVAARWQSSFVITKT